MLSSVLDLANQAARVVLRGRTAGDTKKPESLRDYNKQLQISGTLMVRSRNLKP